MKIATLEWKWFIENPNVAIKFIVMEFYTNVVNNRAMVRGVLVLFGPSNINAFYGLIDICQFEYESYLDNVCSDEVTNIPAMERVEWEFSNGRHKSFEAKYLSKVFHIWKYFICSRLMPTTYNSIVDKDSAILLFA